MVAVADGQVVGGVQGAAESRRRALDGAARLLALGDEDGFGSVGVAVLAEYPGGLLVRAGVVGLLVVQPGTAGLVIPGPAGGGVVVLAEPVVGEA